MVIFANRNSGHVLLRKSFFSSVKIVSEIWSWQREHFLLDPVSVCQNEDGESIFETSLWNRPFSHDSSIPKIFVQGHRREGRQRQSLEKKCAL